MRSGDEAVLRSKYHDWCSARLADRFAELTPEEIYRLAHGAGAASEASPETGAPATSAPSMGAGVFSLEKAGYSELVRRVTEVLATRIELPTYEEWLEGYRREPERYEQEMLGFWRDQ